MTSAEDTYAFSLEWIAEGSGIGEEICGVDKDCIVVPSSPIIPKIENCDSDYVEIQVTEEEVITGAWDDNGVGELEVGGLAEDVLVPLDDEQDEYSRLHPFPCDFCSRRFAKESTLTLHMFSHQHQRSHDCNLCGAEFEGKLELVEHMKVHSYAPIKEEVIEDFDGICTVEDKVLQPKKSKKKKKKNDILKNCHVLDHTETEYNLDLPIKEEYDEDNFEDTSDQKFPIIDPARPYVCQFCGIGFAREKALVSHKLIHAGDSTFECDRCTEIFQSEHLLSLHIDARHGRPSTKKNSNGHSRRSKKDNDSAGIYMCDMCHLVFSTVDEMLRHKENHDVCTGIHTCILCHKEFVVVEELRAHIKETHATTNACTHCAHVFKDRVALTAHLLSHSSPTKTQYPCNVCYRKFATKVSLKRHAATHDAKERNVQCIPCVECGATDFEDGRSLLFHRKIEHGVNLSRLFPCLECGKTFNSRSSQQIHIRIHTGERPYACRFCWKAFGDGGTLRKHERIHTGEKPYVCPVCTKAFNQRVVLREHVRAHHAGSQRNLADACYECMVCGLYFGTSNELCAHLVQHSDENTAKHRLPTVRKINLPRKKKTPVAQHAIVDHPRRELLSPPKPIEYSPPPTKRKQPKNNTSSNLDTMVKLGKATLKNLNSIGDGKRARIVRSGKKGFHKGQNKRFLNKKEKGKNSKLLNGSYASKYAVSQPGMEGVSNEEVQMDNCIEDRNYIDMLAGLEGGSNGELDGSVRTRPRTKNVSYHNMRIDHRTYEPATFPEIDDALMSTSTAESEFLLANIKKKKCGKKKKKSSKVRATDLVGIEGIGESQYINGITIDPVPLQAEEEQIETSIVSDDLEIKQDGLSCQICNVSFLSADTLLKHIQSHF